MEQPPPQGPLAAVSTTSVISPVFKSGGRDLTRCPQPASRPRVRWPQGRVGGCGGTGEHWGHPGCSQGRPGGMQAAGLGHRRLGVPGAAPRLQPAPGPAATAPHSGTFAGAERRCVSSAPLLLSSNCFPRGLLRVPEPASQFATWGNLRSSLLGSSGVSAFGQIQVPRHVGEVHGESRGPKGGGEASGGSCQGWRGRREPLEVQGSGRQSPCPGGEVPGQWRWCVPA